MDGAAEVLLIDARRPPTPSAAAAPGDLAHGSDPAVDVFGREAVVGGGVAVVRLDRRIQGMCRGRGVLRGRRGGRATDGGDGLVGGTVAVVSRVLKNKVEFRVTLLSPDAKLIELCSNLVVAKGGG